MTTTIPAPTIVLPKEEWADADFDFPDGDPIHASDAESDKEEEDWDLEMDLGQTGGAKAQLVRQGMAARSGSTQPTPQMFTIRPPPSPSPADDEDDEDEEWSCAIQSSVPPCNNRPVQSEGIGMVSMSMSLTGIYRLQIQ